MKCSPIASAAHDTHPALRRQAAGLARHNMTDVFELVAALLPLRDIATLDKPATELFAV